MPARRRYHTATPPRPECFKLCALACRGGRIGAGRSCEHYLPQARPLTPREPPSPVSPLQ